MIHLLRALYFGIRNSLRTIIISFFSSFGILFIITFLIIYLSFRTSVQTFIDENLFSSLDINEIIIEPKNQSDQNVFSSSSQKGAKLTRKQVLAVREMEDFEKTFTLIMLQYRARLRIEMFGSKTAPMLPFYAIEPEFFEGKIKNWEKFYYKPGDPVRIISPKFTLVMINNYLYFQGMPQLKVKDLLGYPLTIKFETKNEIPITGAKISENEDKGLHYTEVPAEIYNFTTALDKPGAIVPMDFLTYVAKKGHYAEGKWKRGYNYLMMIGRVKDKKKLPETVAKLEKLGLQIKSQQGVAKTANEIMRIIDAFSLTIVGILIILTIISIFNANLNIVYNMSHKFSLTRILGMTKIQIMITFICESAAVGAIYGIIGYKAGNYLFDYATKNVAKLLPDIANITFTASENKDILLLAVGVSAAVSAVSALIPAFFASNINLFKAVRK